MTGRQVFIAAWLMYGTIAAAPAAANAMPSPLQVERLSAAFDSGSVMLVQAAPAQQGAPQPPAAAPDAPSAATPAAASAAAPAPADPIGNVAALTGSATVIRNKNSMPLKLKDDIYLNDVLRTSADSALGVTFNDDTTFNLTANARITIDSFVYADGGKQNAALFDIAKGTVAFVAAAVARTGDMKISTPTATLGIRGTTGLVEVPEGATAAGQNTVAIKLYPDPDGKVGHIEVNGRDGARLGVLSQGATGFTIRPDLGRGLGAGFAAVPLAISPLEVARDQSIVQRLHAAQFVGRQVVTQRRNEIRNNPALRNNPARQPANPRPNQLPKQHGAPRQNGLPNQNSLPKRNNLPVQNGLPRQNALPKPHDAPALPGRPPAERQPGLQQQGMPSLPRSDRQIRPAPSRQEAAPKKKPRDEQNQ